MDKRSLRQLCLLGCLAIVAGFFSAAPPSTCAERAPAIHVNLIDTGRTIALGEGQQLVVHLPLSSRYDDNTWYLVSNSGSGVKLIAGPNELRPKDWTPWGHGSQVFYFKRESPGVANLVLEQKYFSKPMLLKVVDR